MKIGNSGHINSMMLVAIFIVFTLSSSIAKNCNRKGEMAILLDNTAAVSSESFELMKTAAERLVKEFKDSSSTKIAVSKIGKQFDVVQKLTDVKDAKSIQKAIKDIPYATGYTDLSEGVEKIVGLFSNEDVPKVAVIFAVGVVDMSNRISKVSFDLRQKGVVVYGVGVGFSVNTMTMEIVASEPVSKHQYRIWNMGTVNKIVKKLAPMICKEFVCPLNHREIDNKCVRIEPQCGVRADIAFLVDGSLSMTSEQFDTVKDFVIKLASQYRFGHTGVQAGLVQFGSNAKVEMWLDSSDTFETFSLLLNQVKQISGMTFLDLALKITTEQLFRNDYGARCDVPKIVYIITDGRPSKGHASIDEARRLKQQHGAHIVAVGIGGFNKADLVEITGDESRVFSVKDFESAANVVVDVTEKACSTLNGREFKSRISIYNPADFADRIDGEKTIDIPSGYTKRIAK